MKKKLLAMAVAAVMALGCAATAPAAVKSPTSAPTPAAQTVKKGNTTVKTKKDKTASVTTVAKKKSVVIPATVRVNGVTYKVTTVRANSINKKVVRLGLGANITSIRKNAFTNAKKLRTITVKGTKRITVAKSAFKGVNTKRMTIKVNRKMPAKKYKAFKKALKKAGFKGSVKKVKV